LLALISVVFGALLTLAAAISLGRLAVKRLELPLPVSFGVGAALLSWLLFWLRAAGCAQWPGMLALALAALVPLYWTGLPRIQIPKIPIALWIVFGIFGGYYLIHALAPEIQTDPNVYHLKPAADAVHTGGFSSQIDFYGVLPQGVENLFAMAYSFGGSSSAKLIHLAFLIMTVPLIALVGMRFGMSFQASLIAAAIYFCAPVVGADGAACFTDAALVFATLCVLFLLMEWREYTGKGRDSLMLAAGICAGFCYSAKLTGLLILPLALLFILAYRRWKSVLLFTVGAAIIIAPWMIRITVLTGNPVAPLFNRYFPNPYFNLDIENQLAAQGRYGMQHAYELPYELSLSGARAQGLIGPILLLVPLALIGIRRRAIQVLLALALVLSIPWQLNWGARFLMQSLPFLFLAVVAAIPRTAAWLLLALQALASFPPVVSAYAPGAWRLQGFPVRAALRLESESDYMRRVSWDYRIAKMVESKTTDSSRILDLFGLHAALLDREIINNWQSPVGQRLTQGLALASSIERGSFNVFYQQRAEFSPRDLLAIRVRQPETTGRLWSVQEIEMSFGEQRIQASRRWALSAWPNEWGVPLAFDRNLASKWCTWEPARAGMYLQADFDAPVRLSTVNAIGLTGDGSHPEIYGRNPDGTWTPLNSSREPRAPLSLRLDAINLVRRAGMRYIVVPVGTEGPGSIGELLVNNPGAWGVEIAGSLDNVYLLKIL
jgi:hypothetical protein